MAMLHTVNKSPFEKDSATSCLAHMAPGSSVLFIEDGVYAAIKGTTISDKIASAMAECKVYVLGPDVSARGIAADKIIDGITVVAYDGFVDLVAEHDKVQSWL